MMGFHFMGGGSLTSAGVVDLTVGIWNFPTFTNAGYGVLGSVNPANPTVQGQEITQVYASSVGTGVDLLVVVAGSQAQTLFHNIVIEDGTGAERTYYTADASFSVVTDSQWTWDNDDPVYVAVDTSEVHPFEVFYVT